MLDKLEILSYNLDTPKRKTGGEPSGRQQNHRNPTGAGYRQVRGYADFDRENQASAATSNQLHSRCRRDGKPAAKQGGLNHVHLMGFYQGRVENHCNSSGHNRCSAFIVRLVRTLTRMGSQSEDKNRTRCLLHWYA